MPARRGIGLKCHQHACVGYLVRRASARDAYASVRIIIAEAVARAVGDSRHALFSVRELQAPLDPRPPCFHRYLINNQRQMDLTEEASAGELELELELEEEEAEQLQEDLRIMMEGAPRPPQRQATQPDSSRNSTGTSSGRGAVAAVDAEWARRVRCMLRGVWIVRAARASVADVCVQDIGPTTLTHCTHMHVHRHGGAWCPRRTWIGC